MDHLIAPTAEELAAGAEHFRQTGWLLTRTLDDAGVAMLQGWVDEVASWPDDGDGWMHHRELTDDGETRDERPCGDEDPIVSSAEDERRQILERGGEHFHDRKELAPRSCVRSSVRGRDALNSASTNPVHELRWHVIKVEDEVLVEDAPAVRGAELVELGGGPHLSCHRGEGTPTTVPSGGHTPDAQAGVRTRGRRWKRRRKMLGRRVGGSSGTRAIDAVRARSCSMARRASRRAMGAPMQKCMPLPKA